MCISQQILFYISDYILRQKILLNEGVARGRGSWGARDTPFEIFFIFLINNIQYLGGEKAKCEEFSIL